MTDKEKVLAKFPEAIADGNYYEQWGVWEREGIWRVLGFGPTESEAWANAAKGLE
ncbi:hypothetical protein UFOVP1326_28 [uncultured Caudovirales phage]|uniref:Uncharacterized protein n=1 Tax=uncultured Caudovirales phage TaxID=2100421 RepID=A0A6J5S2I9_9CAUD|nr:hypothetical protein UFOVP1326_28 [uncultured Caudovirales phage]CAB4212438.1 hypothetical protein UFOVP1436_11 [uncultured Caudovirales phage]